VSLSIARLGCIGLVSGRDRRERLNYYKIEKEAHRHRNDDGDRSELECDAKWYWKKYGGPSCDLIVIGAKLGFA
jgi:hypothetical protein